jgi:hypothetical protein
LRVSRGLRTSKPQGEALNKGAADDSYEIVEDELKGERDAVRELGLVS